MRGGWSSNVKRKVCTEDIHRVDRLPGVRRATIVYMACIRSSEELETMRNRAEKDAIV